MTNRPLSIASLVAMGITGLIALVSTVYAIGFFYGVLVLYPNDANYSLYGIIVLSSMLLVAISTVVMSRYVWGRIARKSDNSKKIYGLAAAMTVLPLPVALISPSAMIFFLFAVMLLALNWIFGRSPESQPAA